MKEFELFLESGKSAGIWACGECRMVKRDKEAAVRCCRRPYECTECGQKTGSNWLVCEPCRQKKEVCREKERFEKASKVLYENYEGHMVYWGGDYHDSLEDLLDHCVSEEIDPPSYVWACRGEKNVYLTMDALMDLFYDDAHEDWEWDGAGAEDMEKALTAFNFANDSLYNMTYWPDWNRAILLP